MRRSKKDMLVTKEQILCAAFECFYENGFEKTSLEMIAKTAGMTRGAIYWHFEDKEGLYRAVVFRTLEKGDVASFAYQLPVEMSFEERLDEVFWMALNNNKYVDFVFKTMNYVSMNKEMFPDILENLRDNKVRLLHFFDDEVKFYMRVNKLTGKNSEYYSTVLFLLFEGIFLSKNISDLFKLDQAHIKSHIRLIITDLITLQGVSTEK